MNKWGRINCEVQKSPKSKSSVLCTGSCHLLSTWIHSPTPKLSKYHVRISVNLKPWHQSLFFKSGVQLNVLIFLVSGFFWWHPSPRAWGSTTSHTASITSGVMDHQGMLLHRFVCLNTCFTASRPFGKVVELSGGGTMLEGAVAGFEGFFFHLLFSLSLSFLCVDNVWSVGHALLLPHLPIIRTVPLLPKAALKNSVIAAEEWLMQCVSWLDTPRWT